MKVTKLTNKEIEQNKQLEMANEEIKILCEKLGTTPELVAGETRKNEHIIHRRIVARELRKKDFTFKTIGKALNKHHSTIISLCNSYDYMHVDADYRREIKKLRSDVSTNVYQKPTKTYEMPIHIRSNYGGMV